MMLTSFVWILFLVLLYQNISLLIILKNSHWNMVTPTLYLSLFTIICVFLPFSVFFTWHPSHFQWNLQVLSLFIFSRITWIFLHVSVFLRKELHILDTWEVVWFNLYCPNWPWGCTNQSIHNAFFLVFQSTCFVSLHFS